MRLGGRDRARGGRVVFFGFLGAFFVPRGGTRPEGSDALYGQNRGLYGHSGAAARVCAAARRGLFLG